MRLPTLLLILALLGSGALVGAIVYRARQDRREWVELRSLKNRDLYHARYEDRALELVGKRLSGRTLAPGEGFVPWAIVELEREGREVRIAILELRYSSSPSMNPVVRCNVFDEQSVLLTSHVFEGGGNLVFRKARSVPGFLEKGESVVEVESEPNGERVDVGGQYYALREDRLVLLRVQNGAGRLAPNVFVGSKAGIWPDPPHRSDAEWESALRSEDVAEILGALAWLTADPARASALLGRPPVAERLSQLQKHPNAWVVEAAQAAVTRR